MSELRLILLQDSMKMPPCTAAKRTQDDDRGIGIHRRTGMLAQPRPLTTPTLIVGLSAVVSCVSAAWRASRSFIVTLAALVTVPGCCTGLFLPGAEAEVRGVVVDESGTPAGGLRIGVATINSGNMIVNAGLEAVGSIDFLPQTDEEGRFEVVLLFPRGTCPRVHLAGPVGPGGYVEPDELEISIVADDCTRRVVVQVAGGTMVSADGGVIELLDSIELPPCPAP